MEAAAALRKARITALRELRRAEEAGDAEAVAANVFGQRVKAHYRTSEPPPGVLALHTQPVAHTLEDDVSGMQAQVIAEDTRKQAEELDLANIAPRRPNWDLRRDFDERVALLEPATKAAIHTLIVRRISASSDRNEEAANVLEAESS